MALICELASAIGIDDTQITFRIKDHEGVDLTTTEDGLKLVLAVNYMNSDDFTNNVGQDIGTIITLRHFNFSLGYGFEGGEFDYDGLFQGLEGLTGTGEGMFQYSQGDLFFNDWAIIQVFPAYGNLTGATFAAHGHSNNNYWGAANAITNHIQHRAGSRGRKRTASSAAYNNLIGKNATDSVKVMRTALAMV